MNIKPWRYYARLYQGFYRIFWLTIGTSIAMSALVLPVAYLIRIAVDKAIPAADLQLLLLSGAGLFLLNLGTTGMTLWAKHASLKLTKTATQRLRDDILTKLFSLSREYYTRVDRKRLQASIVQDTERLDNVSQSIVVSFLPSLLTSLMLCVVLIALNWYLFLISISVAPVVVLVNRWMLKKVKEKVRLYQRTFVLFSKGIQFVLQVLDLTRTLAVEPFEIAKQRRIIESVHRTGRSMNWLNTAYAETNTAMTASVTVVIMIVGGLAIISRSMTMGDLLSFYVVLNMLRTHASTIASSVPMVIAGNESLKTLYDILNAEDKQPYNGTEKIEFCGHISLNGVHFRYHEKPLLRDINLEVRPNETVAIMGLNGSGKSTIINLILGYYRPQQGQINADGYPYEKLDLASLRSQIGVVPQDPILFPGTILENITYGHPEIPRADVIAASEVGMAHEFIKDLPSGYDTLIGEHGTLLSGGQRQRIAIARALLRRPRFLILDEPTNHLDSSAVFSLMNNLQNTANAPGILLVTHDNAVVRESDRVCRLQDGALLEMGPLEQLP